MESVRPDLWDWEGLVKRSIENNFSVASRYKPHQITHALFYSKWLSTMNEIKVAKVCYNFFLFRLYYLIELRLYHEQRIIIKQYHQRNENRAQAFNKDPCRSN